MTEEETITRLSRRLKRLGYATHKAKDGPEYLKGLGFEVATVFDVGVAAGTPALYQAFRDAKFVLIEPIAEYERKVRKNWGETIDFDFHACGVGDVAGELELSIPVIGERSLGTRATLTDFDEDAGAAFTRIDRRVVPVKTLDDFAEIYAPPFGLKIDTEGFEMEVIAGAGLFLKRCAFVIAEVSMKRRYAGGYRFSNFVAAMAAHGFELVEFLREPSPQTSDGDALFAPFDTPRFDFADKRLGR